MRKSTKILLIILGVFVVAGLILTIVFRQSIFAVTPPPPGDKTTTDGTDGGMNPNPEVVPKRDPLPQAQWKSPGVDSGYDLKMDCPSAEDINKASTAGTDGFNPLSFKITVNDFVRADNERVYSGVMKVWDLSTKTTVGKKWYNAPGIGFNSSGGSASPKNFSASYDMFPDGDTTFKLDTSYQVDFYLFIDRPRTLRLGWDLEGFIYSNSCQVMRSSTNPGETLGGTKPGTESGSTAAYKPNECGKKCVEIQDCGGWTDPICRGMCSFSCAILDMMASIFGWAFSTLNSAVGLS